MPTKNGNAMICPTGVTWTLVCSATDLTIATCDTFCTFNAGMANTTCRSMTFRGGDAFDPDGISITETVCDETTAECRLRNAEVRRRSAERAERLLVSMLDRAQRRQWRRARSFRVIAASGRIYRICQGTLLANIYELNDRGQPLRRFCAHPDAAIPHCDALLAQKLLIETDEAEFLRIANEHPLVT